MGSLVLGGDHRVFLDALSMVLSQHGHDVGAVADSAAGLVRFVRQRQPDACVINCDATDWECGRLIRCLRAASPGTTILLISADADERAVLLAVEAGAVGYLHRSRSVRALVVSIEQVLRGKVIVDIPRELSSCPPGLVDGKPWLAAPLTAREQQCLAMLVEGLDTAAMMARLGLSRTTIRTHIQGVMTKLGVHSRLAAASLAVSNGLLSGWPGGVATQYSPSQAM